MNKYLIPRLALLLGLGLAPLAAAETQTPGPQQSAPAPSEKGHRHGWKPEMAAARAEKMAQHLKLTADQKAKIKAIREKHQDQLKGRREAAQQSRKAFFEAAKAPETSVDQLRKLHQAMSDNAFEMMLTQREMRLETRQVLTPDQREKAAEVRGRMAEHMKMRREQMRDMRTEH